MPCPCCCPCNCDAANFSGTTVTLDAPDCDAIVCDTGSLAGTYSYTSSPSSCTYQFNGVATSCNFNGTGNPGAVLVTVECVDGDWLVTVAIYQAGSSGAPTLYGEALKRMCVVDGHLTGEVDVEMYDSTPTYACTANLVFA